MLNLNRLYRRIAKASDELHAVRSELEEIGNQQGQQQSNKGRPGRPRLGRPPGSKNKTNNDGNAPRRGRPPGSRNRNSMNMNDGGRPAGKPGRPAKRQDRPEGKRRGRPPGSKNKPKVMGDLNALLANGGIPTGAPVAANV